MSSTIEFLNALAATKTCVTGPALAEMLGWNERRLTTVLRASIAQGAVAVFRKGCYRATARGHDIVRMAAQREVAARERKESDQHDKLVRRAERSRGTFRAKVWRALRIARKASVAELLMMATSERSSRHCRPIARGFLKALIDAGYVAQLGSKGTARFVLIPDRNSGPLAPMITAEGNVYDPNIRRFTYLGGKVVR